MKPFFAIRLLLSVGLGLCAILPAQAWDGNWTNAGGGNGNSFYDPDSTQSDAGTDERPQTFFIPPPRDFKDVDPEELGDYFHGYRKEYTPYAMARISQNIRYNDQVIPIGYYLVKPGDATDGSPTEKLKSPLQPPVNAASAKSPVKYETPAYRTFVIKRLGKVVAVVPINRMETYRPPRKDKIPRRALAWIEMEDRHPVLKFYYHKRLYSTDFQ